MGLEGWMRELVWMGGGELCVGLEGWVRELVWGGG